MSLFNPMRSALATVVFTAGCAGTDLSTSDVDYDVDDDGLIEINSLADLSEIRNNLTGDGLYGSNDGCPVQGCRGFELAQDLDFDTNGNGQFDEGDDYWNQGKGWLPIAHRVIGAEPGFSTIFDGNGYQIKNLSINRPDEWGVGLFSFLQQGAKVKNLGLTGRASNVVGRETVGALAGLVVDASIVAVHSEVTVHGPSTVGGITGLLRRSSLMDSHVKSNLTAENHSIGGLVGVMDDSHLRGVFFEGAIEAGINSAGGIAGVSRSGSVEACFTNAKIQILGDDPDNPANGLYAGGIVGAGDVDVSGCFSLSEISASGGISPISPNSEGAGIGLNNYWVGSSPQLTQGANTRDTLECPEEAGSSGCASEILFLGWDSFVNDLGEPYWDFGSIGQLPGLSISGVIHRPQ